MIIRMRELWNTIKKYENIVIFGAGAVGQKIHSFLLHSGRQIECYFDNDVSKHNSKVWGAMIKAPKKETLNSIVYIVAVNNLEVQEEMYNQLLALNISEQEIVCYSEYRNYEYLKSLNPQKYVEEVCEIYYERFAKDMNWENPQTFNEIIHWEKINVKDYRRTRLADKYLVREWVSDKIGNKYLPKQYGHWDNSSEIEFDILPNRFVLKLNNGSGRNILVSNKAKLDIEKTCKQLDEWKEKNYAYELLEFHYKDIIPQIICEEYLEGLAETEYDYDIYCFHGKPVFIHCIKGSHRPERKTSCYDIDWNRLPFNFVPPFDEEEAPIPNNLKQMLQLTEKLCEGFEYVRIDWYNLSKGRLLFSEMTFSPWGGMGEWVPEEYDKFFGDLIREKR